MKQNNTTTKPLNQNRMTIQEKNKLDRVLVGIENLEKFMLKVRVEKRWRSGYLQALKEVKLKLKEI